MTDFVRVEAWITNEGDEFMNTDSRDTEYGKNDRKQYEAAR